MFNFLLKPPHRYRFLRSRALDSYTSSSQWHLLSPPHILWMVLHFIKFCKLSFEDFAIHLLPSHKSYCLLLCFTGPTLKRPQVPTFHLAPGHRSLSGFPLQLSSASVSISAVSLSSVRVQLGQ